MASKEKVNRSLAVRQTSKVALTFISSFPMIQLARFWQRKNYALR